MARHPLSQAQTLLSAERYRLKSEQSLLRDEHRILSKLADVEADCSTSRFYELERVAGEMSVALLRIHELGEEKLGALPQASLSVFGTLTCGERISITLALEPQDFKDGAVLIKEGDPRDAFFIIVQGQVTCMQRRRPGLDESVLKRDYLLTNQPCEFTVTAVGEVKVLVFRDARWRLAVYRDPAKYNREFYAWLDLAARRARKGPKGPGSHKHPVAGRKVKDPSRATQLLQLTRLHGWLPRQRIYLLDPQGNCFSVAVPATVARHQGGSSPCARPS